MIKKPTLLILGAGASAPYGFPVGKALIEDILSALNGMEQGFASSLSVTLKEAGETAEKILEFRNALRGAHRHSVEAFLERRPEYMKIGKLCITHQLKKCENPDLPFGDWYEYLAGEILNCPFDDIGKNKLAIITYNFDRSLEFFLQRAVVHSYGKTELEAALAIKQIPIVHLHGSFGLLPGFAPGNTVPFSIRTPTATLKECAERLKIVLEAAKPKDDEFKKAGELIAVAERIGFLGFGYGELNLRRLFEVAPELLQKESYGTCFGFKAGEKVRVEALFSGKINLQEASCLDLLRETGLLFS